MNRIKQIRILKGITQLELMKMTGIHYSQISLIENGYRKPSEKIKKLLAKALKVKKSWLFPEEK